MACVVDGEKAPSVGGLLLGLTAPPAPGAGGLLLGLLLGPPVGGAGLLDAPAGGALLEGSCVVEA